ncbi:MAG: Nif3-like dinuclear metal center hexameric protein [Muribaculaceae bacterium]|nr:Nif3-like dinuclear metal center hexameric protein [Muribaculaceae bacterium]
MKVCDIATAIEQVAPLSYQEDFDNAGIQVGDPQASVTGVLLCTDVTEDVVREAIAKGRNLVILHHPLIFHPLKKIAGRNHVERIVALAIKNDVNIYSAHTNMDSAPGGVNHLIAAKMGLSHVEFMSPETHEDGQSGIGVVGDLQRPVSAREFLLETKRVFGVQSVRYSGDISKPVQRVAVCGGAGSFLVNRALELGADIFVTADMKYHEFMGHESQIILADIGHYESEHFTKEIFLDIITKKNPTFAVDFAETEKNQLNYL